MLPELIILTLTLYAECRGEPWAGKLAVASVIQNRAVERKLTLSEVCLQSKQFSVWNDGGKKLLADYEAGKCRKNTAWHECLNITKMLYDGTLPKTLFNHYYNSKLCNPKWAKKLKNRTVIANHVFGTL